MEATVSSPVLDLHQDGQALTHPAQSKKEKSKTDGIGAGIGAVLLMILGAGLLALAGYFVDLQGDLDFLHPGFIVSTLVGFVVLIFAGVLAYDHVVKPQVRRDEIALEKLRQEEKKLLLEERKWFVEQEKLRVKQQELRNTELDIRKDALVKKLDLEKDIDYQRIRIEQKQIENAHELELKKLEQEGRQIGFEHQIKDKQLDMESEKFDREATNAKEQAEKDYQLKIRELDNEDLKIKTEYKHQGGLGGGQAGGTP